jgi:hypothetical protein
MCCEADHHTLEDYDPELKLKDRKIYWMETNNFMLIIMNYPAASSGVSTAKNTARPRRKQRGI